MPAAPAFEAELALAAGDLERLVSRLARFSPRARRNNREGVVTLVGVLVAACNHQQRREHAVPELDDHVLADAVAVIGHEVIEGLSAEPNEELLATLRVAIDQALTATR